MAGFFFSQELPVSDQYKLRTLEKLFFSLDCSCSLDPDMMFHLFTKSCTPICQWPKFRNCTTVFFSPCLIRGDLSSKTIELYFFKCLYMTRLRTEVTEGAKIRLMGSRDLGAKGEKLCLDILRPMTMKVDCLGLNLDSTLMCSLVTLGKLAILALPRFPHLERESNWKHLAHEAELVCG